MPEGYTETLQLTFIPQVLTWYIWYQIYSTDIYSPNCWHHISNTNIYISKYVHSPTLCPNGTQKTSNLHLSPMCWHDISNTNIYIQLTYIPKIVGKICPIEIYYPAPEGRSETPQHTFLPQVLAWYVQCQYINTTGMYSSIKSEYKYKYYLIYIFYWIYFAYI